MTLRNKEITILFILPLIFATGQSYLFQKGARGQQNCDSTSLGAMVQQFYCTSDSLKTLSWYMVHVSDQYI